MNVFLVGFMGSGKTTIGKKLAHLLGKAFIDMDEYIENKQGKTIAEIFSAVGEETFRALEKEKLCELVKLNNTVISTGGGAPCFHNNMQLMNAHAETIYIQVPNEVINGKVKKFGQQAPRCSPTNLMMNCCNTLKTPWHKGKYIIYRQNI
ncbi:MAG: shikimate kinase [Bacteroidales bacterium]|nr:shikimate kinase [Bacteroidales bacterium]